MRRLRILFGSIAICVGAPLAVSFLLTDSRSRGSAPGGSVPQANPSAVSPDDPGVADALPTPSDAPARNERSPTASARVLVSVVDTDELPVLDANVRAVARDGTGASLPAAIRVGAVDPDPEFGSTFDFDWPRDAHTIQLTIEAPGFRALQLARTLEQARPGVRVVLIGNGAPVLTGRLLDAQRRAWPSSALSAWFGPGRHLRASDRLVFVESTRIDGGPTCGIFVDFDTSEFRAAPPTGRSGNVILLDGERLVAQAAWKAGDPPLELIADPQLALSTRGCLSLHVEPPALEPLRWSVQSLTACIKDPWSESIEQDEDPGPDWKSQGLPCGAYVARCRTADDAIVAAASIVLNAGETRAVTLRRRTDVDVVVPLANDEALIARVDHRTVVDVEIRDRDGAFWGSNDLRVELDGAPRLVGRLPVGSWHIATENGHATIDVAEDGTPTPPILRFAAERRVRFRVGPAERGTSVNGGRWIRALIRRPAGTVLDDSVASAYPDADGFAPIELVLPPSALRIEFSARAFAPAAVVELDAGSIGDEPILVIQR